MPKSVLGNDIGYTVQYKKNNNLLQLARSDLSQNNDPAFSFMTPKDAKLFDKKFDDGRPNDGEIHGDRKFSSATSCVLNGKYNLGYTGLGYFLQFF